MRTATVDIDTLARAIYSNTDASEQEARALIEKSIALPPSQGATSMRGIRDLIADDAHALTFQSFGQYRTALLKSIDATLSSPSEEKKA